MTTAQKIPVTGENLFARLFRKLFWNLHSLTWDEYLETTSYAGEIEEIAGLALTQSEVSQPTALDVGCATGNYALALANKNFQVIGIDYAAGMIHRAKVKAHELGLSNAQFLKEDFNLGLQFPNSHFNLVLAAHVFQGIAEIDHFIAEMYRVLIAGGLVFIVAKKKNFRKKPAKKKSKSFLGFLINAMKPYLFTGYRKHSFDMDVFRGKIESAGFIPQTISETPYNHIFVYKKPF